VSYLFTSFSFPKPVLGDAYQNISVIQLIVEDMVLFIRDVSIQADAHFLPKFREVQDGDPGVFNLFSRNQSGCLPSGEEIASHVKFHLEHNRFIHHYDKRTVCQASDLYLFLCPLTADSRRAISSKNLITRPSSV
jgi:hypothetical protein